MKKNSDTNTVEGIDEKIITAKEQAKILTDFKP